MYRRMKPKTIRCRCRRSPLDGPRVRGGTPTGPTPRFEILPMARGGGHRQDWTGRERSLLGLVGFNST